MQKHPSARAQLGLGTVGDRADAVDIETTATVREARAVLRLFRERLDTLADPLDPGFGFDLIRLAVPATEALNAAQTSLDRRAVEGDKADLSIGQRVFHQKFGYGRIIAMDGNKLDIEFDKAGPKKVLDSFVEAA